MRTSIAFAIYVSLATGSFAEVPVTATDSAPGWTAATQAGLAASQHHHYEEALAFFERSWETSRTPGERGASATDLGVTYQRLGRINEAKQWLERARQAWSAAPVQDASLAFIASDLADLYRATGDYAGAERLLRGVLAALSSDPDSKALLRNNLADLLREEGRSSEAQPLFKESADSSSVSSPRRLIALIGLADIDRQNGNWEASVNKWNEALETCRHDRDEKTEAVALRGLALTWLEDGVTARAEPLFRRSLQMMENNPDTPPEQVAEVLSGMGELYRSENKLALAEDEWSRALRIDQTALGEVHPQVAWLLEMLSDVYSARGEFTLARKYATRAVETMSGSFGDNSLAVAAALADRALVDQRAGDLDAATKDYDHAIGISRAYPENRLLRASIAQRYAELLKTMHRSREAKALLSQGEALRAGARSFQ